MGADTAALNNLNTRSALPTRKGLPHGAIPRDHMRAPRKHGQCLCHGTSFTKTYTLRNAGIDGVVPNLIAAAVLLAAVVALIKLRGRRIRRDIPPPPPPIEGSFPVPPMPTKEAARA